MTIYNATDLTGWNALVPVGATIKQIGTDIASMAVVDWVANGGVYIWDTPAGNVRVYEDGHTDPPEYDDGGSTAGHPAALGTTTSGELYFTKVVAGVEYLPSRLVVTLTGTGSAPSDVIPTSITPHTITISEDQALSQVFAALSANQANCTFTEQADAGNKFTVSGGGGLSLSAGVTEAGSPYTLTVRATNGGGSFDQVITVNVTAGVPASLVGDAQASTSATVLSTITSWLADWNGTAAGIGKTAADHRYIELTADIANLDINGRDASAYPGITIFSGGPYTDEATFPYLPRGASSITTQLKFNNNKNLHLSHITARDARFETTNTDCTFTRCCFHGDFTTEGAAPTLLARWIKGVNCRYDHCMFIGFSTLAMGFKESTDLTFENCVLEYSNADGLKGGALGATTNVQVLRTWLPRIYILSAGSHSDNVQVQSGVNTGFTMWGVVGFPKDDAAGSTQTNGGQYMSDTNSSPNANSQQNMYCFNGAHGIKFNAGANPLATNNTVLRVNNGANGSVQGRFIPKIGGGAAGQTLARNYVHAETAGTAAGEGTDGIKVAIGNLYPSGTPNWTTHLTYFDNVPLGSGDINVFKPKSGAATHWAFGGTKVGAWERAEEIFVDGLVPGNVGWPVARWWQTQWDPSNTLGTSWTGTYDADGNNV